MARLFISYARKDGREVADRIAAAVSPHEPWLDRVELRGGQNWWRAIARAIDGCDAFIAVVTAAYGESRVGGMELTQAFEEKKRLIPLIVHQEPEKIPLLLRDAQRVVYDPGSIDDSIRRLIDDIEHPQPPRPPTPASLAWNDTVLRSTRQAGRFLRQHVGTFDEKLYVRREAAEESLARFMEDDAPSLIVIGDSGAGKTNLVCNWITEVIDQGHAILAYDCSTAFEDSQFESEIAKDLRIPEDDLTSALERIDAVAAEAGRRLFFVFESVGDYRGDKDKSGPDALLRRINAFAGRLGDHTRVVLSCNAAVWNRIQTSHRPINFDRIRTVQLGLFTDAELTRAWERYRVRFELQSDLDDLPQPVRERLHEPVLLRITAEAFSKSSEPLPRINLAARMYERFFQNRVRGNAESTLVDRLAEKMLSQPTSTLPVNELARDDELGPLVLSEDPASPYLQLIDNGVLHELHRDGRTFVQFRHTRLAAYALASYLRSRKQDVKSAIRTFLAQDSEFPLGWEIAKILLMSKEDRDFIAELAVSADSEHRELAAEALVELHGEDADHARAMLESLFTQEKEEGQRTALKAAYNIGPGMEGFFRHAAIEGAPTVREAVANTLYLIWRRPSTEAVYLVWKQSPEFTYEILSKLLDELFSNVLRTKAIFSFVVDLTVIIYINHCDDERVIAKTAEVLHKLWVDRLRLDRAGTWFSKWLPWALGMVFGRQILDWLLLGIPEKKYFALPQEDRNRLGRIGDLYDPAADITAAHDDLRTMLLSPIAIFRGSAMTAIAIHAARNFATTKPLIDALWKDLDARGRLWLLAGFTVLMSKTPNDWVGLLEMLTESYVTQHPDAFLGDASRLPGKLDVVFVPLALAYGKRGDASMRLFGEFLRDDKLAVRCIQALSLAGFYYPQAMFETIRPVMEKLDDPTVRKAVVDNLATVRTLHYDAVDRFLTSCNALEDLRHDVYTAADVDLVRPYIRALGYYNNSVHLSLCYPRMRKVFSTGSLKLLATARCASQFVDEYTGAALRMLHESKYDVLKWTEPE